MDILIVKLGALGDVINTLPLAMRLKKHLNARIHWLVAPLSYPMLSDHAWVDRPIRFDIRGNKQNWLEVLHRLRGRQFDIVLDLQRILKSGVITWIAAANRRIGFDRQRCKEMTWLLPFERIPPADPNAHMLIQYLEFGAYLNIAETEISWGIQSSGLLPKALPGRFVVLNIGATKPANRWTVEGFADLVRSIRRTYQLPCVLTGGAEDVAMAARIQALANEDVYSLAGQTSLPELIDVIAAAAVVVTCDTGPMHLAVALKKKVIALFGPSDHRRTGPFRGTVVRATCACAPCNRKACAAPTCMQAIRPEQVMVALESPLKASFC